MSTKDRKRLLVGLAFLAPNILGFLAFTVFPLLFSLLLAFTNWDLRLHNMWKHETLHFIGLANFTRLVTQPNFWKFLGNTLFLMIGIPISIALSLLGAVLLSHDFSGGRKRTYLTLLCGAVLVAAVSLLVLSGAGASAMTILFGGLAGGLLVLGALGGSTVYRTVFYIPHFTSGVATFILWKKLYSPQNGPINNLLAGPLETATHAVRALPPEVAAGGAWIWFAAILVLLLLGVRRLRLMWYDGELGSVAIAPFLLLLLAPIALSWQWAPAGAVRLVLLAGALLILFWESWAARRGRRFLADATEGLSSGMTLGTLFMVGEFVCLGLGLVAHQLPVLAAAKEGLQPPEWLTSYHWAKPAIMIMGLWAAIGSNNMLLYLAALHNVPPELYEAADIDGASRPQKFWHVTWPQLAPTTFFIVVMSVIGGLQGGFDIARTMTRGGPAGSTTTLSYFIYTEGFETGRLGYSSAVAWTLFAMVLIATLINWKFGNKYVND